MLSLRIILQLGLGAFAVQLRQSDFFFVPDGIQFYLSVRYSLPRFSGEIVRQQPVSERPRIELEHFHTKLYTERERLALFNLINPDKCFYHCGNLFEWV